MIVQSQISFVDFERPAAAFLFAVFGFGEDLVLARDRGIVFRIRNKDPGCDRKRLIEIDGGNGRYSQLTVLIEMQGLGFQSSGFDDVDARANAGVGPAGICNAKTCDSGAYEAAFGRMPSSQVEIL